VRRRVHPDVARLPRCGPVATLQDRTRGDPWRCLVVCVLLNRTRGTVAEPILWEYLARFPTARVAASASRVEVEDLLRPLGLSRTRSGTLAGLAEAFASGGTVDPSSVRGVGRYALDAWAIFVEGRRDVEPSDRVLVAHLASIAGCR